MFRREFIATAGALAAASLPSWAQAPASRAICYNCPPEWADWGGMLKLINQKINIAVPPDNKNSGQSLAALIAEKANPVADVVYFGGQVGPQAREAGVLAAYKPQRFGRHSGHAERPGRLLVHDSLRHAGSVREHGRAARQAGAAVVEATCSSPNTRAWSGI